MPDLKPPSQNRPGAAPSRRRTAILRAAKPVPTFKNFRQRSLIWGTWFWAHACGGRVSPRAALEYKDARAANKPKRVEGIGPPCTTTIALRPPTPFPAPPSPHSLPPFTTAPPPPPPPPS